MLICDDLSILYVNLVNVGPVTSEFKKVVGVHPLIFEEKIFLRQIISSSTSPIFTTFSFLLDIWS